jgi:hypothetical protein
MALASCPAFQGQQRRCAAEVFAVLKPGSNSQRLLQLVAVGIGPPGGQLPADGDRFLGRGQRVLSPPQLPEPGRQVVQRADQAGAERIRAADAADLRLEEPRSLPLAGQNSAGDIGATSRRLTL